MHNFIQSLLTSDSLIKRVFRLDHISPEERRHLKNVYGIVLVGLLVAACGCDIGGLILHARLLSSTGLSLLATAGSMFSMYRLASSTFWTQQQHQQKNVTFESGAYYMLSALCSGLSLSGIVLYTAAISLELLKSAVLMSAIIFGCLTLASLFARRRSFLFLTSIISSIAFYTMWASLFGLFLPSNGLETLISVGGLTTGVGYILIHTQTILENARYGGNGPLMDAMTLHMDFVHLFINILRVLLQRSEDNENRQRRRRKQSSSNRN